MKAILLTPIIMMFVVILMASAAHGFEADKYGVEAKIQEIRRVTWVKEHKKRDKEVIFIYNDPASIADREFALAVNKINEKYTGN